MKRRPGKELSVKLFVVAVVAYRSEAASDDIFPVEDDFEISANEIPSGWSRLGCC